MLPALHKGVAFIASSLITRKTYVTIEYQFQQPSMFVGEISERVDVRDFDRGSHLSGTYHSGQCDLHDAKSGTHVTLSIQGNTFEGLDSRSGAAFRGSVDRDRIYLFDEETRQRFVFTAQPERLTGRPRVMRPPLSGLPDTA